MAYVRRFLLAIALCCSIAEIVDCSLQNLIDEIKDLQRGSLTNGTDELVTVGDVYYHKIGAFSMDEPWRSMVRPVPPPKPPEQIPMSLLFYSRPNPNEEYEVDIYPDFDLAGAPFDPNKLTVIIAHGFHGHAHDDRIQELKDAYLERVNANVFVVNWGSSRTYTQTVSDLRVIGKVVAMAVQEMIDNHGLNPAKMHLIGHSLGAHLCSYIAKDVPRVGRLTGLDPSQLLFDNMHEDVRMNRNDATFVDVIHTNARPIIPYLAYGVMLPCGHVDFYINGGFVQPQCDHHHTLVNATMPDDFFGRTLAEINRCSHMMALDYMIDAVRYAGRCIFRGHRATLREIFRGIFVDDPEWLQTRKAEYCLQLGLGTERSRLRGLYVVFPMKERNSV